MCAQASKKESGNSLRVQDTGKVRKKPSLSKKTAYILRHKRDCHGREGVWSWEAYQALGTTAKVSLHTLDSKNAEEPPVRGNPVQKPEEHFKNTTSGTSVFQIFCIRTFAEGPRTMHNVTQNKLHHTGNTHVEDSIQEGGRVLGLDQNQRTTSSVLHFRQPGGQESRSTVKGLQELEALIYVADMERAQEDKSSASRLSTFASSVPTRFPNHAS